jgi:hypothetical protein
MNLIDTIGAPISGAMEAGPPARLAYWDIFTRIVGEEAGPFGVGIEIRRVVPGQTDECWLPTVLGFTSRVEAAAYAMAWVDAWSSANR